VKGHSLDTLKQSDANKAISLEALESVAWECRRQRKNLVWTNGFFEILHAGHIEFLMKAARLGDVLVVGINSDASTHRAWGTGHPVTSEQERIIVLSAVECIDYITVYDEADCTNILERLHPDVYAKGLGHIQGDINPKERQIIEKQGGTIALIAGDPAKTTAAIITRIQGSRKH